MRGGGFAATAQVHGFAGPCTIVGQHVATRVKRDEGIDVRAALDDLEEGIERLRLAYEKYFSGIERMPPTKDRAALERLMRTLDSNGPTSTVLRFRLGGLRARLVTYKHYWNRVEGQIERGMSRRDRLRQRNGQGSATPTPPPQPPAESQAPAEAAADPESAKGSRRPRPKRLDPAAAGLDPAHLREVFKQLVKAKRAAGESTTGLTYLALVRKLTKEAPKLRQKHGCERLEFKVAMRNGKVRLRSEPK